MTEAAGVERLQSGVINTSAKKDYGPLDFTGKFAGRCKDLPRSSLEVEMLEQASFHGLCIPNPLTLVSVEHLKG